MENPLNAFHEITDASAASSLGVLLKSIGLKGESLRSDRVVSMFQCFNISMSLSQLTDTVRKSPP